MKSESGCSDPPRQPTQLDAVREVIHAYEKKGDKLLPNREEPGKICPRFY